MASMLSLMKCGLLLLLVVSTIAHPRFNNGKRPPRNKGTMTKSFNFDLIKFNYAI